MDVTRVRVTEDQRNGTSECSGEMSDVEVSLEDWSGGGR